jgi:hypothetical protein
MVVRKSSPLGRDSSSKYMVTKMQTDFIGERAEVAQDMYLAIWSQKYRYNFRIGKYNIRQIHLTTILTTTLHKLLGYIVFT